VALAQPDVKPDRPLSSTRHQVNRCDRVFGTHTLLGTIPAVALVTAILAFVMILNNYFGFTGLQRFAQYVAVPIVVLWGLYATIKSFTTVTAHELSAVPHTATPVSMFVVVGAMVGLSTWGNEPDVFRYSKPGRACGGTFPRWPSRTRWAPFSSRSWGT
jgi:hypothetical protein